MAWLLAGRSPASTGERGHKRVVGRGISAEPVLAWISQEHQGLGRAVLVSSRGRTCVVLQCGRRFWGGGGRCTAFLI